MALIIGYIVLIIGFILFLYIEYYKRLSNKQKSNLVDFISNDWLDIRRMMKQFSVFYMSSQHKRFPNYRKVNMIWNKVDLITAPRGFVVR